TPAQQTYARDCPNNCNDKKTGLVSFQMITARLTNVPISQPPGGAQRRGWYVRVKWRLWVSCQQVDNPIPGVHRVEPRPTIVSWRELEELFGEHYGEENLGRIDTHLEGIGE